MYAVVELLHDAESGKPLYYIFLGEENKLRDVAR